ncbi:Uncharacterised protein [Serratia quinivorans]|nr:Uncharacterised protein [Serratia quinivorans]
MTNINNFFRHYLEEYYFQDCLYHQGISYLTLIIDNARIKPVDKNHIISMKFKFSEALNNAFERNALYFTKLRKDMFKSVTVIIGSSIFRIICYLHFTTNFI